MNKAEKIIDDVKRREHFQKNAIARARSVAIRLEAAEGAVQLLRTELFYAELKIREMKIAG